MRIKFSVKIVKWFNEKMRILPGFGEILIRSLKYQKMV